MDQQSPNAHSAIVDGLSTMMQGDYFVKVVAWYDNEWGYALVAWQISRTS